MLLSHDVTLLATVADGIQVEAGEVGSCHCPLAMLRKRPAVLVSSPAIQLASSVQVLLAQQLVKDRVADDGRRWGLLLPLLRRPVQRAVNMLSAIGIDSTFFTKVHIRQIQVEAVHEASPVAAAAPTAELSGSIFAQLGKLEGADPRLRRRECCSALSQLGHALGELVYLVDAFRDLASDLRSGSFNPCLETGMDGKRQVSPERSIVCRDHVARAVDTVRSTTALIPWRRHHHLVNHILCERLPQVARAYSEQTVRIAEAGSPAPLRFRAPLLPVALCGAQDPGIGETEADAAASLADTTRSKQRSGCTDIWCCHCCDCGGCDCEGADCDCCGGCDCCSGCDC
jgi:hypothetical protein